MSILDKIKSCFSKETNNKNVSNIELNVQSTGPSMEEREEKVFEKETLNLQKLYEQWSCKEEWLLYEEGIPLLFGIEPGSETTDEVLSEKMESLWEHAQDCVNKNLLSVINKEKPVVEWQVRPLELYSWGTVSRISMPEEFSLLMSFVAQTVKSTPVQTENAVSQNNQDFLYQKHREIVLGAAASLLVNAPELCKNKKGKVVSNLIAKNILENEDQWFADDRPMLAETAMTDLIEEYLKLTRPVVS
jgi:hypothetical protein